MPTILILGATSDIGYAIAKKFAAQKYNVQLAARNTSLLQPLQSDIEIRSGVSCTLHQFDALAFDTHSAFYQALPIKPDVVAYVIGYMNDNEKVIGDWHESLLTINTNYTGAVSILNIVANDFAQKKSASLTH
ncbi:MAG: SDR family NAD(P)-dependent oxidoreductase [Bacteroidota bacterium]